MKHRGYEIVKAKHPAPFNLNREAYDIVDGAVICKGNISTIETAKMVIDVMVRHGIWKDKSTTI